MIPTTAPDWLIFFRAVTLCVSLLILYRRTIATVILEGVLTGMIGGMAVASAYLMIQKGVLKAVQLGDLASIIPILWGLGYVTFFVPRVRNIFRVIVTVSISSTFGLTLPLLFKTTYSSLTAYTALRSAGDVLMIAFFALGLISWTFAARFDRPLRYPRIGGFFLLYTYCALQLAPTMYRHVDNLIIMVHDIVTGPAVVVPLLALALILVDAYTRKRGISIVQPLGSGSKT